MMKCASCLSVSSRKPVSEWVATVLTPICAGFSNERGYTQGDFFVEILSFMFCDEIKRQLSIASMPPAINLNIIELLITIMITGINFQNITISAYPIPL